jgi:CspA family cold shock protein
MEERFEGQVIWFNNERNIGFISRTNEKDLFVHFSDINCEGFKTLKKDQKVSFTIGKNNKGQDKATDVKVIK